MKAVVMTFLIIAAIAGGGGYLAWNAYQQSIGATPTPTEAPPPPPKPVDEAAAAAARRYHDLTKQLESDKANGDLYAKRGRAGLEGKAAIMNDLSKVSIMAIGDLARADELGCSSAELYNDLVLAVKWIDVVHPVELSEDKEMKVPAERTEWFEKTRQILEAACRKSPDAHRARVNFIEFRLNKLPAPSDRNVWRTRELESLDTLIKLEASSADAEQAGDIAKELGKKPIAKAYYQKAIDLQPAGKDRISAKMKGL